MDWAVYGIWQPFLCQSMRVSCTLLELWARYALYLQVGEGISFVKDLSLPSIDPNDTQACYFSESPAGLERTVSAMSTILEAQMINLLVACIECLEQRGMWGYRLGHPQKGPAALKKTFRGEIVRKPWLYTVTMCSFDIEAPRSLPDYLVAQHRSMWSSVERI